MSPEKVEPEYEHETLPSGKTILREFASGRNLIRETHRYGLMDIVIQIEFKDNAKTSESYFAKNRMVSKKGYEKARVVILTCHPQTVC